MREKLIELLDNLGVYDDWYANTDIADHLIAAGVTIQKWIPVTERLPEKHEHILALTPNKIHGGYYKWLIWYDPKSGFYDSDPEWGDIEMDDVTHWMPLPEPPKGE